MAVVGLSLGSTMVKKTGAPSSVVAFWRLAFGALFWQLLLAFKGTRQRRGDFVRSIPSGLLFGVNLAFFFAAATHTRIANAEFIGALTPLIVVPIAARRLGETVQRAVVILGAVALSGVALIVFAAPKGRGTLVGDLYAVTAVMLWSLYLLRTRVVRAVVDTSVFMAAMTAVATVVVFPLAISTGRLFDVPLHGWVLIVVMAVTSGMVSHGLLAWAQQRVPVSVISLMQLAQPGLGATWAFVVIGERVRPIQIAGMAVVVAAVGLIALRTARGGDPRLEATASAGPIGSETVEEAAAPS